MKQVSTLWLIPARGGSKGIPNKNIKSFCGESLVGRAITQALECASSKDIIFVSTDSIEIKEESEKKGIFIPFMRPSELASDTASTYSVILHVLKEFKKRGKDFKKVVLLQPTSPFRTVRDIKEAEMMWTPDIDMIVSVCETKSNPYFNTFETNENGYLKISKGEGNFMRRQDAPKVWEYNGAVYVITTDSLMKEPISHFKKIIPYEMPVSRSVDLDTPEDWIFAELLFERLNKK